MSVTTYGCHVQVVLVVFGLVYVPARLLLKQYAFSKPFLNAQKSKSTFAPMVMLVSCLHFSISHKGTKAPSFCLKTIRNFIDDVSRLLDIRNTVQYTVNKEIITWMLHILIGKLMTAGL